MAPLVTFGVGMVWGAALANNCNWGHGDVDVNVNRNSTRNVNRSTDRNSQTSNRTSANSRSGGTQKWQSIKNRSSKSGAKSANSQAARGYGSGPGGSRPSTGNAAARPSTGNATRGSGALREHSASVLRRLGPKQFAVGWQPFFRGGHAFSGVSSGSKSSSYSNRGASSRSGGGGGGGGSRGGGRGSRGGGGGRR